MAVIEIDSFVSKFKSLWASGHQAKLSVNSKRGKVWINLRVGLESPEPHDGLVYHQGPVHGNARQRRNHRRASARAAAVTKEVTEDTASNAYVRRPCTNFLC